MVAFGHSAVGVIVGITAYQFLGNGDLASGLAVTGGIGVISHYVMDFIPHGHYFRGTYSRKRIIPVIIFDLIIPIILFTGVTYLKNGFSEKLFYVMFGIGGCQLPDVIDGLIYSKKIKPNSILKMENNFHEAVHWHGRGAKTLLLGLRDIWQLLIILAAAFLVYSN